MKLLTYLKNFNAATPGAKTPALFDRYLLFAMFGLIIIGLVMVTSASMVTAQREYHDAFHYLFRQMAFFAAGVVAILFIIRLPVSTWERYGPILLLFSLFLLVAVLIPHVGREVNGSRRWLGFGPFGLQVSEFVKLALILYLSGYLVRRETEVRTTWAGFIKPIMLLGLIGILLLMQPDFGATVVITCTMMTMMFMAGIRVRQFSILLAGMLGAFAILAISAPYRLLRLTTFLNPWANAYGSGYQLTQSLIAFGRGSWFGVGLGNSIQKLFYLPEAHTDFLFAVLAEELGLIGVIIVIGLFVLLIYRIIVVARRSQIGGQAYSAYIAYGTAVWFGMQAVVNIGVSSGILPTKGLTLPLMSYGGSSLLIDCIALGIILRIDHESRLAMLGFKGRRH